MKRSRKILSMMITILFCISLFATTVSAASRPSMFPEEYEYNVTQGETVNIKFTICVYFYGFDLLIFYLNTV